VRRRRSDQKLRKETAATFATGVDAFLNTTIAGGQRDDRG